MSSVKKIPKHVALIMGGNESWAKERNLSVLDGYKKGFEKIRFMPAWFFAKKIPNISIMLFSGSDWKRPREEVNTLMKYLKKLFCENTDEFKKQGWKIVMTGKIDELPGDLPEICTEMETETKNGTKGTLNICLNYDGRDEIIQAIKKMIANNVKEEQVHEGIIRKYLYNNEIEDPDLIVNFGGVQRNTGFQLWQGDKSEFICLKKDWPDFEPMDVENIVEEFSKRKNLK
jgi:undecaprenyl diphosphate synthase